MLREKNLPATATACLPSTVLEVIDFEQYIPTVLSRLVTRLRRSANIFFAENYGITLLEWRIISLLASDGPMSGYAIWNEGGLEKAAVTRCLRGLAARGLVAIETVAHSKRQKTAVALTGKGHDLHAKTFPEVLLRHQRLVSDLSADEIGVFFGALAKLHQSVERMADSSITPLSDHKPTKTAQRVSIGSGDSQAEVPLRERKIRKAQPPLQSDDQVYK